MQQEQVIGPRRVQIRNQTQPPHANAILAVVDPRPVAHHHGGNVRVRTAGKGFHCQTVTAAEEQRAGGQAV